MRKFLTAALAILLLLPSQVGAFDFGMGAAQRLDFLSNTNRLFGNNPSNSSTSIFDGAKSFFSKAGEGIGNAWNSMKSFDFPNFFSKGPSIDSLRIADLERNYELHWSEPYYNYLVYRGIMPVSRQLPDLDATVSRGEVALVAVALREFVERHHFLPKNQPRLPVLGDVPNDDPNYGYYVKAASEGLIHIENICPKDNQILYVTMNLEELSTKSQTLQSIIHALDLSIPIEASATNYQDVTSDDWYAPYVDKAVDLHMLKTTCDEDCYFYPDSRITRGDMFYMAANAVASLK